MFHILLVDDDEDEHLFFQWSLEKIAFEIRLISAYSCREAKNLTFEKVPDLVFVDINLPGEDGFYCLQEIRHMPSLKYVPVYLYSTEISERSQQRAAELGATGCMKKSRDNAKLAKVIFELLNNRTVRILQQSDSQRESSTR
jgi:chemosensory pili system protein ChpA (sensor histidine kinase/response regulator)